MSDRLTAALTAVDAAIPAGSDDAQLLVAAKVKALMIGYEARWGSADWELVGDAEQVVVHPIVNPETGRISRSFEQAGKYDGVATGYGKNVLVEHKSTSEEVADPNAAYWRRLKIDSQVSSYMLKSWQSGLRLDGTLYDVIRKPNIRPKHMAAREVNEIRGRGTYLGFAVPEPVRERVAAGQSDECLELYGIRLAGDAIAEPDKYYQRRMIPRLDDEVVEYAQELWDIASEIRLARLNNTHFRNSEACMQYGRPCAFLPLCSGEDTPDTDRWTRSENVHDELPGVRDGRRLLTNSRIKVFQTCRRKHHLRYDLGLRRVQDEESEALFIGTVLHEALAAWWTNTKGDSHANGNRSAVNAIAEHAAG